MRQIFPTHKNEHREATEMRKQRNMPVIKKQENTPESNLYKMEANNLLETEFYRDDQ